VKDFELILTVKSCVIYLTKKIRLHLKLLLLRGSHPKSARDSNRMTYHPATAELLVKITAIEQHFKKV